MVPSDKVNGVGYPGSRTISRLDGWPICSPADASPTAPADAWRTAWGRCGSLLLHRSGLTWAFLRVKWSGSSAHQKLRWLFPVSKVRALFHDLVGSAPDRKSPHPVAAQSSGTNIPRSADGAQEVETILSLGCLSQSSARFRSPDPSESVAGSRGLGDVLERPRSDEVFITAPLDDDATPLAEYLHNATRSLRASAFDRGLAHLTAVALDAL